MGHLTPAQQHQTTAKILRPARLGPVGEVEEANRYTWQPDPDDPPLVAPYADPFLCLLVGLVLGGIGAAIVGLVLWAVIR